MPHSAVDINLFFIYINNIDRSKKIQFTREVVEDVLEFLDLKRTFDKEFKRISVGIITKATNTFPYVLSSTCFPKKSIVNVPKGVGLRLRRTCESDNKLRFLDHFLFLKTQKS